MDKVQKHNSFSTNTPSSESYRNYLWVISVWSSANAEYAAHLCYLCVCASSVLLHFFFFSEYYRHGIEGVPSDNYSIVGVSLFACCMRSSALFVRRIYQSYKFT